MPSDFITLNALARELNDTLAGGKIRRICQPEKDEITLSVFNGKTNLLLVVSANPNSPRVHLTTTKKENPYAAPPLLMILRKYVGAAVIKNVSTLANDRILRFTLQSRNEMFDDETFYLVCELMGRYSNLILLNEDGRILDSLHKLVPDEQQKRQILPNALYLPPEQNKVFIGDKEGLKNALEKTDRNFRDFLVKETAGVSGASADQILFEAGKRGGLTPETISDVAFEFTDIYSSKYFCPTLKTGEKADFFPYRYAFAAVEPRERLNDCADEVFSACDREQRVKAKAKELERVLNAAVKKARNSISILLKKLSEEEKAEEIRIKAELITSNLYKIAPRETKVEVYDYYKNENVTVDLDPALSPSAYAQKLYKKYAKLKRGKEINAQMLEQNEANLEYFATLLSSLGLATNLEDVSITEEEMIEAGLIRKKPTKGKEKKILPKYYAFLCEGFKILCGRGGAQNEEVTFKEAKENDLWLHAAKSHGAHVVILTEKKAVPDEVLLRAAEIAAYYSERRSDENVAIDYTIRKNVRRHPAKKIGLVIYNDYKTVVVKPDPHSELSV